MPTFRLQVRRHTTEHATAEIEAVDLMHALDQWNTREDDDAFGCQWVAGKASGDAGIDDITEVQP